MGAEPPYMYQRPSTTSFTAPSDRGYSPKAVTQASWSPREPRPQLGSPLIKTDEMNRHPDSYFIVPYGNLDWKPMGKSTKSKVKWMRIVLLNLRVCTFLGALGLLFCIICIRPTGESVDWIVRVAPGIGILHAVYAMYHLARSAKGRTPASSASYMVFASIIDAGILPFLAFTAFMANTEHQLPSNAKGQWQTLFPEKFQTQTIIYATYLISIATGGAHIFAFIVSIYLAMLFRRISKLPPDMNPLEDNLTSRRSHKRNKSSISTLATEPNPATDTSDKLLVEKSRQMRFVDTRNHSVDSFGSTPTPQRRSIPASRDSPLQFQTVPYPVSPGPRSPTRSPNRASAPPAHHHGSPIRGGAPRPHSYHPTGPVNESWRMHSASPAHRQGSPPRRQAPPELQHLRHGPPSPHFPPPPQQRNRYTNRSPKPLGMNPPTPSVATTTVSATTPSAAPGAGEYARNPYRSPTREGRQALRDLVQVNGQGNGSPVTWEEVQLRPSKERLVEEIGFDQGVGGMTNRGKGRFYGSLRGMIGGRKGGMGPGVEVMQGRYAEADSQGVRVLSSGVDEGKTGVVRIREVSGKVAEEGRSLVY